MKALPGLFLSLLALGLHAEPPLSEILSDTEISKDVAAKIKAFTCNDFESRGHEIEGQIIKLKFTSRETRIDDTGDGTSSGWVQFYVESSRRKKTDSGWGTVKVTFPKVATAWFGKVPTNSEAKGTITVIGKVESTGVKFGARYCVTLIGREIKTDAKGTRAVW